MTFGEIIFESRILFSLSISSCSGRTIAPAMIIGPKTSPLPDSSMPALISPVKSVISINLPDILRS